MRLLAFAPAHRPHHTLIVLDAASAPAKSSTGNRTFSWCLVCDPGAGPYDGAMIQPSDFHTADTALVLVDHQVGTITWAGELTPDQRDQLKIFVTFIAKFAKAAGMPIVLTSSLETEAQGLLLARDSASATRRVCETREARRP